MEVSCSKDVRLQLGDEAKSYQGGMVVGSHPPRRTYTGMENRMAHVTLCCLQKSHIPVVTELQFMKCHMSVESDLGNESLRKKIISVSTRVSCVSYFKLSTFACLCFPLFSTKST